MWFWFHLFTPFSHLTSYENAHFIEQKIDLIYKHL
uniref:Uncharacterized protein n=1 Tax=viral metagenome TaxID=1070528 RepID=A0A6C0KPX4_9ZZZZ